MKKDNAPIYNRTVKDSCDTFGRLDAQFEESPSHCARVGHAKIGTKCLHLFRVPDKAGDEACRKRQNFCLEAIAVESDEPSHMASIANMLYASSDGEASRKIWNISAERGRTLVHDSHVLHIRPVHGSPGPERKRSRVSNGFNRKIDIEKRPIQVVRGRPFNLAQLLDRRLLKLRKFAEWQM